MKCGRHSTITAAQLESVNPRDKLVARQTRAANQICSSRVSASPNLSSFTP
jgi:hypothetical protein